MANAVAKAINKEIKYGCVKGVHDVDISSTDFQILYKNTMPIPFFVKAVTAIGVVKVVDYFGNDKTLTITELNVYDECQIIKIYKTETTATGLVAGY